VDSRCATAQEILTLVGGVPNAYLNNFFLITLGGFQLT